MNAQEFTLETLTGGAVEVLSALTDDPTIAKASKVPQAVALVVARNIAEHNAKERLRKVLADDLQEMYDTYVTANGEHAHLTSQAERDEWEQGIDDQVENLLEPYVSVLSMSWFGMAVVDTRLHEPNGAEMFVRDFANDVWRKLTFITVDDQPREMTTEEVLAAIGISASDVASVMADRAAPSPEQEKEIQMADLKTTLTEISEYLSIMGAVDHKTLIEELDNASDTDDGLAMGSAARLGIDAEGVAALRHYREDVGDTAPGALAQMLSDGTFENLLSVSDAQEGVQSFDTVEALMADLNAEDEEDDL